MVSAGKMRRMVLAGTLFMFLILVIIPLPAASVELPDDGIRWGPWLTATTANATTVNWRSEGAVPGAVEYAERPELLGTSLSSWTHELEPSSFHHIRISGLSPVTTYSYRILSDNEMSRTWAFSTYPETGSISFIVYGDTRDQLPLYTQDERHRLVAEQIAGEEGILFVINTGDLVQDGENPADWDRFFAAAGSLLANATYYPVLGNHEENSSLYYDIFDVPPVYSFTCGDLKAVVLDSNLWASDTLDNQAVWMNQEFEGWNGWKIVSFHYPIYSSQEGHNHIREDLREVWEPVLVGNGVSAVFTGHVHAYEHYQVEGIHHFVLATGGAPSYPLSLDKPPGHVTSIEDTLGYAVVTVDPEEDVMVIRYIEVARVEKGNVVSNEQGMVRDVVLIQGHDSGWWPFRDYMRLFQSWRTLNYDEK